MICDVMVQRCLLMIELYVKESKNHCQNHDNHSQSVSKTGHSKYLEFTSLNLTDR